MQLMMYVGNDLIDTVPLELERISKPGYLGSFKRTLKMQHSDLLQLYPDPPEFLVIDARPKSSGMKNK